MSKLVEKDGKHYRMRRGALVEIPEAWVGSTVHPQTKRKRPSQQIHKRRKEMKRGGDESYNRCGGGKYRRNLAAERESTQEIRPENIDIAEAAE